MGGKAPRRKGDNAERRVVNILRDNGIDAQRIPLSGAAGGAFVGDIRAIVGGETWLIESKKSGAGFKRLYSWLVPVKALVVCRDRDEPLVVMRMADFVKLAGRE